MSVPQFEIFMNDACMSVPYDLSHVVMGCESYCDKLMLRILYWSSGSVEV